MGLVVALFQTIMRELNGNRVTSCINPSYARATHRIAGDLIEKQDYGKGLFRRRREFAKRMEWKFHKLTNKGPVLPIVVISITSKKGANLHFASKSSVCLNQRIKLSLGKGCPGAKLRPPNQSSLISSQGMFKVDIVPEYIFVVGRCGLRRRRTVSAVG